MLSSGFHLRKWQGFSSGGVKLPLEKPSLLGVPYLEPGGRMFYEKAQF